MARTSPAILLRYGLATGIGSACSFLAMVLVARSLAAPDFVVVNLVVVAANVAAQLGAGFDSASARLRSRGIISIGESIGWALSWRSLVCLASLPLLALVATLGPQAASQAPWTLRLLAAFVTAIALSLLSISLIESQAKGRARELGLRQLVYYGPLLAGLGISAFDHSAVVTLWWLTVAAVTSILLTCFSLPRTVVPRHRPSVSLGSPEYRRLSLSIFLAGAGFAAAERLDVIIAAKYFEPDVAATLAVALRVAVMLGLAVSAFQTMSISSLSAARNRKELDTLYVEQWPIFLFLAGGVLVVAAAGSTFSEALFGSTYDVSLGRMLLLTSPFLIYAAYSPYVLALAGLGRRIDLTTVTSVSVAAKVITVVGAAATHSVTLLFASGLIGASLGGLMTLLMRAKDKAIDVHHL